MGKNKTISDISSLLYWLEREGWEAYRTEFEVNGGVEVGDKPFAEIVISFRPKEDGENDNEG